MAKVTGGSFVLSVGTFVSKRLKWDTSDEKIQEVIADLMNKAKRARADVKKPGPKPHKPKLAITKEVVLGIIAQHQGMRPLKMNELLEIFDVVDPIRQQMIRRTLWVLKRMNLIEVLPKSDKRKHARVKLTIKQLRKQQ